MENSRSISRWRFVWGGSGNAATTLLGLNELFGGPVAPEQLQRLAASLGSDVPFFLQSQPAAANGRGSGSSRSNRSPLCEAQRLC